MKKYYKFFIILLVVSFIVPQIALASWWNPFSWNIWNKIFYRKAETKIERIISTPTVQNTNEQKTNDQSSEIEKLKKEVEELKTKSTSDNPTPKQLPPAVIEKSNVQPTPEKITPPIIETWSELENKFFASADQKGWTAQTITNALGEKRYYRKEGSQWVRKNSEAETLQPYVAPPTSEQLANVRRVCLWNAEVKAICDKPEFMPGYYSNIKFRSQVDIMFSNFLATMSEQQKQKIAAEKAMLSCLMAIPDEEIGLSPATQDYLTSIRCGTVTDADRTNYELSRIKSSVDELKYRLDSKTSFPSLFLDPIKTPTFDNTKWQVRWDGSGGTITNSTGGIYQFHCEDNTCRSY